MTPDERRVQDILEGIRSIERYAMRGRKEFESEELVFTWIVHHLIIVGEAASNLSDEFKSQADSVPWREVVAMRNILVHQYSNVDADTVWSVVTRDLPALKHTLEFIVDDFDSDA